MVVNADNLKVRAQVLRTIRAFFDARGFVEVETPVRIAAPAPEPHIDCPASGDWFLRASPELQMKKLLAAGLPRIYQIGPCFREGERGRRHAPEFTMLECTAPRPTTTTSPRTWRRWWVRCCGRAGAPPSRLLV